MKNCGYALHFSIVGCLISYWKDNVDVGISLLSNDCAICNLLESIGLEGYLRLQPLSSTCLVICWGESLSLHKDGTN